MLNQLFLQRSPGDNAAAGMFDGGRFYKNVLPIEIGSQDCLAEFLLGGSFAYDNQSFHLGCPPSKCVFIQPMSELLGIETAQLCLAPHLVDGDNVFRLKVTYKVCTLGCSDNLCTSVFD